MIGTGGDIVRALGALAFMSLGLACSRSAPPAPAPEAPDAATAAQPEAPKGPPWRPGYQRPPVVDVHGHILPSGLERLARVMDENGLSLMVNLSGGSPGRGLEVSVEMQKAFPRLIHFYNPDWRRRTLPGFGAEEAARLEAAVKEAGFRGLKISKALGLMLTDAAGARIPVDWPELDPLWARAGELGVPVAIHTADPKAFWDPPTPDNERYEELSLHPSWSFADPRYPDRMALLGELERVIVKHPKTTFISVHFGNNAEDLEHVDRMLSTYPNLFIDTAARVPEFGRHPPEKVRAFFVKHQTRILFGTDLGLSAQGIMLGSSGAEEPTLEDIKPFFDAHWRYFEGTERGIPHPTPVQGRWTVDAIGLPDEVLAKLYFANAERVLKLERAPSAAP